tara:strand:+ start:372 stop:770 length:399 start_codon:yes stop_codon:yes gene_type:complete
MKLFDMLTNADIQRIKAQGDLGKRVKELENSLSISLENNDKYQRDNKRLKDEARAAEGETSIIKGIGMNSPEMKAAQTRIKELEDKCRHAGRAIIELNLKYESAMKEVDRLSEENTNLKTMMKGPDVRDNNS